MRILILGAGPGGLAAAEAASSQGARVLLVDDNAAAGGQIWRAQRNALTEQVATRNNIERMQGTRLVAVTGPHSVLLDTPDGARTVTLLAVLKTKRLRAYLFPTLTFSSLSRFS